MAAFGILGVVALVVVVALVAGVVALVVWGVSRSADPAGGGGTPGPGSGAGVGGGAGGAAAGAVGAGRAAGAVPPGAPPTRAGAHTVRRVFQYALLLAMTIITAVGLSDLLARAFGAGRTADLGRSTADDQWAAAEAARMLAEDLTFAIVGSAVLALVVWWTWRTHRRDPGEAWSPLWAISLTLTTLVALVVTVVNAEQLLAGLLGADRASADTSAPLAGPAARVVVWGVVWALLWVVAQRALPPARRAAHRALGSAVGLFVMTSGFVALVSASFSILLQGDALVGGPRDLASAGATLVVGILVWLRYWVFASQADPPSTWWLLYVLVVGVAGGLVLALTGASLALWDVLVWVVGDPGPASAARHFSSTPGDAAMAVSGVVLWWYHRGALARADLRDVGTVRPEVRSRVQREVHRVYTHLVAAVALAASATGLGTLVVAVIESLTPGEDLGMSVRNTLLGAATLLVVGVPVWVVFWRGIQRAMASDPLEEGASPTRRTALTVVLGLATVAAVIALITVVMTLLQDAVSGDFSSVTLRSARYGIGVLVAAAAVAGYFATVWREDRAAMAAVAAGLGAVPGGVAQALPVALRRRVVLVGDVPADAALEVARRTGTSVEVWRTPGGGADTASRTWGSPEVVESLVGTVAAHPRGDLLVVCADAGTTVIEVERAR